MCAAVGVVAWAQAPAQEPPAAAQAAARCRVEGTVKSGTIALPGVAVLVHVGDALKGATSTDANGKFSILFAPNATYHVTAELTAFAPAEHDVVLAAPPCDTKLDFLMTLRPRTEALPTAPAAAAAIATAPTPPPGAPPASAATGQAAAGQTASTPVTSPQAANATPAGRGAAGGRGGAAGTRFETLTVQADANGASSLEATPPDATADLSRMLPPGFSVQSAQAEAVAINGSSDALSLDRGALGDRLNSIGRGEFDPSTGQFAQGFGPGGAGGDNPFGGQGGRGGLGGDGAGGGGGGRGGPGGGRGGPGGPGGFTLGGRGGRGQSPYQGSANYTFGSSALDATSLQPHDGAIQPVVQLPFSRNNAGGTIGGPLKIPGLYSDTNRRTNFQFNYTGNHSTQLQDQYATVPTDAQRNGDFSSTSLQLIDPKTGQPYVGNQIPSSEIDPSAQALLNYIPHANVPGATTQNYHNSGTTLSTSNSVSLRVTQNLSPNVGRPGGAGGRGGAGGGRGGAGGGRGGGRGGRGLNVMLNAQLQYRENASQSFNVFPGLGGTSKSTSLTAPISVNISHGRTTHILSVNLAQTKTTSSNLFSNVLNASGDAGINYPATPDPLNWGLPNLTFSNFSLRSSAANVRTDSRLTSSYTLARPIKKQQVRFGVDFRHDLSSAEANSNARGTFTFTGLYTGNGALASGTGADFADFLLGLPQQASLQVGGLTKLRENAFDVYVDDNWQRNSRLTISMGLRYEVAFPYVEVNGKMANLDVTPTFTQATVVTPATGTFPAGLVNTDYNNVGPRLGLAYRLAKNTILRGGYSITYNSGSYASIARQLVGQPPFALTETNPGSLLSPITLENGLLAGNALTTNNYGVDRNYALGLIQTWNGTLSKDLSRNWTVIAGYTGTKGSDLDLLRAPNRNADGTLRIPDVQAFIWESSGGHSILNLGNFQLRRRLAHGFAGGVNYTLSKSMDNASSLGAGGAVVAQNDQDLAAEYALSNFDQRHQFTGDLTWELPFGVGRKWLSNGGKLAAIAGEWSMNLTFSAHSGSPFTARVVGAINSVSNGTSGSLRANYTGAPIQLTDPTLLAFFNTAAFQPPAGSFGTSARNMIIGPGGHVVNAQFSRDMRIGGNRAVTIQVNANNLFNTIQWAAIDTNLNSQTFGQVTRFAGMRTLTLNLRFRF